MRKNLFIAVFAAIVSLCSCGPKDGEYSFQLFTTNDVHGTYFDSVYVAGKDTRPSLLAVSHYVDSVRNAVGEQNVLLIDAGDCLQGDNAAYYYNYVDTVSKHLYSRIAEYMKYDAIVVGNHDIETGHPVYDRIRKEMNVPFLAANAIRTDNGKPYFQDYTVLKRNGLKIAVVGFTNPNIKNWLSEEIWEGMTFKSLMPLVQQDVDRVIAKENPHVVIVAIHAGTGSGNGESYESQGLDLFKSLKGVDFLICSHDHRPYIAEKEDICLINAGSHSRNIGHGTVTLTIKDGKCVGKELSADLITVHKEAVDQTMKNKFRQDYEAVKAFTLQPVGKIEKDLRTRDSFKGMCEYINLLHYICLDAGHAAVSFAAPLTFNGFVHSGELVFNDLFTIYPYENQLFVVKMKGKEIKNYLEYSYDKWINTVQKADNLYLLKIAMTDDPRNGQKRYSFTDRFYNFDSAGGLIYTVDVTESKGSRVSIEALANGEPFLETAEYEVAMTSYRANGAGFQNAAGIDPQEMDSRIVGRYPEIRNLLYDYFKENGKIESSAIWDRNIVGEWHFIPENIAEPMLKRDMELLFPRRR